MSCFYCNFSGNKKTGGENYISPPARSFLNFQCTAIITLTYHLLRLEL
jgi:hypothetical protein